jgi:hypothetical protein
MDQFERLTFDEDDGEIVIEEEETHGRGEELVPALCLAGRFLTMRPIRVHTMKEKMKEIWCLVKGVTISEVGDGVFLFQFNHNHDLEKVLKGGPWFFGKHMLILGSMVGVKDPSHVSLFAVPFWIQIHQLPVGYMSEKIGEKIATTVGEFLEYDAKNNSQPWRKYMRLGVHLDVRKPLMKTRKLKKKDGNSCEIQVNYERLGTFCYYCGLLGLADDSYDLLYEKDEDDDVR